MLIFLYDNIFFKDMYFKIGDFLSLSFQIEIPYMMTKLPRFVISREGAAAALLFFDFGKAFDFPRAIPTFLCTVCLNKLGCWYFFAIF